MMGRLPVILAIGARLGLGATAATAQARDAVSAPRLAARRWFAEAKFGLFIHWGAYSQLGAGEWVMHNRKIAVADYEWLPATGQPTQVDPRARVGVAQRARVRFI